MFFKLLYKTQKFEKLKEKVIINNWLFKNRGKLDTTNMWLLYLYFLHYNNEHKKVDENKTMYNSLDLLGVQFNLIGVNLFG